MIKFRAEKIDSDEVVEGYYSFVENKHQLSRETPKYIVYTEINPQTLQQNINGNWYSMEELEDSLNAIKWMEDNSNNGLCDYYNRSENE